MDTLEWNGMDGMGWDGRDVCVFTTTYCTHTCTGFACLACPIMVVDTRLETSSPWVRGIIITHFQYTLVITHHHLEDELEEEEEETLLIVTYCQLVGE